MSHSDPLHAPNVPSAVGILNPLVRRLVGAGLPFGPNVNLTVRGRTSGRLHTFPVAIVRLGERRFVQSPFGEVQWVRNLRADGDAVVSKGRRREDVTAVEVPPEVGGPVLEAVLAPYLRSRLTSRFATRFFDVRRDSPPEAFVDEARRHPIFELLPTTAAR